jgi:hypothetical protein
LNRLSTIWQWVSTFGTNEKFSEHLNRKLILGNRIASLAGTIVLAFSFLYLKYPPQFYTYLIAGLLCYFFLFLNYVGLVSFSRLFFTLAVPIFVVIGGSFAPESLKASQKLALISCITIPLVLFGITEKRMMILGVVWTIMCFVAFDYFDFHDRSHVRAGINPKVVEYISACISFSVFIATFLYLQMLNNYAETKLKSALDKTSAQRDEIEQQNEKLEIVNRGLNIRALSAELNPHFLYNSLNSVQHFLTINDKTSSLNYLSKFGRLIRQFIDYSDKGVIPLSDELKLLAYYLELESLRFESMFRYEFDVEEELLLYNIYVPLLLLQIHIENAILHGLINKDGDRHLRILFRKQDDTMLCVIEDNGIGREASALIRKAKGNDHQSRGIEISTNRLRLMYDDANIDELIKIIDLYNDRRESVGTRVEIRIPFEAI